MKEKKEGHNYIFPKVVANVMKAMDQRTQYESALISMTLILFGMIVMTIYMDFYTTQSLFFKIMFTFNMLCGLGLLGSFLVTQFQAYQNFMIVMEEMNLLNTPIKPLGIIETTTQKTDKLKGGIV